MKIFSKTEAKHNGIAEKYKKGREAAFISQAVEYNGKSYREIIFKPISIFGKSKDFVNGIVFIDGSDNVIDDKKMIRELTTIFFNLEQLLEDSFLKNLNRAIVSSNNLKAEEDQAEFLEANLMLLSSRNVFGAEKVKEIVSKLPQLKRENNEAIENYINKVNMIKDSAVLKSDTLINEIKPLYTETLMKNFEKIKLIGSGRNHYGDVKREALKIFKKKLVGAMGSNMSGSASRLEYELNHLMKVVDLYDNVIGMSNSEYIKYLNDMDKDHINDMIDKNRA